MSAGTNFKVKGAVDSVNKRTNDNEGTLWKHYGVLGTWGHANALKPSLLSGFTLVNTCDIITSHLLYQQLLSIIRHNLRDYYNGFYNTLNIFVIQHWTATALLPLLNNHIWLNMLECWITAYPLQRFVVILSLNFGVIVNLSYVNESKKDKA